MLGASELPLRQGFAGSVKSFAQIGLQTLA